MTRFLRWILAQPLLQASFWSTLLFSAAHPFTNQFVVSNVDARWLAVNSMLMAVFTIIISTAFQNKKWSDAVYKLYPHLCIAEAAVYLPLLLLLCIGILPPSMWLVIDAMAFGCITRNLICGSNRMKRFLYKGKSRERYDNSGPIVCSIACIIGGLVAMIPMPFWLPWALTGAGIVVDNIFYIFVYIKLNK